MRAIESSLREGGIAVLQGGAHDRWDLEGRTGSLGSARLIMGLEDHPLGMQFVRFRWWPRCAPAGLCLAGLFLGLGAWAALDEAWVACAVLSTVAVALAVRALQECATAMGAIAHAFEDER